MASNAKKDKRQSGKRDKGASKKGKPGELTRLQKIVIVAFIVIFAFSTLAGALASVVQTEQAEESSEESEETTVEDVDGTYEDIVASLESKVEEDPEDEASLLALGRYYLSWGADVSSIASTDDETTHANELFDKAMSYYDQYIALEDSPAARVDRALCEYYKGDTDAAVTALTEVTTSSPDYPLAWAYLGMLYEEQELTDEALAAYEQAVELDPSNEYGAYSYAQQRIYAIQSAESEDEDDTDATDDATDAESTDATTDDSTGSDGSAETDESTTDND